MARSGLTAGAVLLPLMTAGCDRLPHKAAQNSVTVRLPPARPPTPAPGFAFERTGDMR